MSHIQYTICRSGTYYFNKRVPKHAVKAYGTFIRQALFKCPKEAAAYSKRLSNVLEGSWSGTTEIISPVNIPYLLSSFKPKSFRLTEIAEEYINFRDIDQQPPRIAVAVFVSLAGDRDVSRYTREDAKLFVRHLEMRGNKTAYLQPNYPAATWCSIPPAFSVPLPVSPDRDTTQPLVQFYNLAETHCWFIPAPLWGKDKVILPCGVVNDLKA
jgi:hypothetical protein